MTFVESTKSRVSSSAFSRFPWGLEISAGVSTTIMVVVGSGTTLLVVVSVFGAGAVLWALQARADGARQLIAASAMMTLLIAIPINRLASAGALILLVTAIMIALGIVGAGRLARAIPRGLLVVVTLVLILFFVTAISTDDAALLRFAPFVAASLPIFAVVGGMTSGTSRRLSRFVVAAGVGQSLVAMSEVFLPLHLWAPAQLGSFGQVVPLMNPLLGGEIERSQGTLGHPLALGFLLLVSIALLARQLPLTALPTQIAVNGILLLGVVASGSRNSLIVALLVLLFFSGGRMTIVRATASGLLALLGLGIALGSSWLSESAQKEFTDSGSYTHRVGAYEAIGRLLVNQDVIHVLFGNGFAATARLFKAGLLQTDGFNVVDNQFILTLAQGGLVTALLLVGLAIGSLVLAPARVRPAVVAIVATMLIFDTLNWPSSTIISFFVFSVALSAANEESDLDPSSGMQSLQLEAGRPPTNRTKTKV